MAVMAQPLTAIIPCRNERLNIRPCIESLRSIADEILVADSGSTDETLDIVREIGGCRIVQREYVHSGDFKNWAIPQAKNAWIFMIDADERVTPGLAAEIRQILSLSAEFTHDGYWVRRENYFLGHRIRFGDWGSDKVIRLFRRDASRYVGDNDHAEVSVSTGNIGKLRERLTHFTMRSYDQYLAKLERYTTWQAQQWDSQQITLNRWRLMWGGPYRFFRCYVLRLGFLDGLPGFQISVLMAIYAYLKQAHLWELRHAQQEPDAENASNTYPTPTHLNGWPRGTTRFPNRRTSRCQELTATDVAKYCEPHSPARAPTPTGRRRISVSGESKLSALRLDVELGR